MKPHVHAELIKAWADGAEIECYGPHSGKWETVGTPAWGVNVSYRIKDPYHELKAAAEDPTKQIRFVLDGVVCNDWKDSSHPWVFNARPEDYEIRDKPKPKVKMWQWIYRNKNGRIYLSIEFSSEAPDFAEVIGPALWTEIEVES